MTLTGAQGQVKVATEALPADPKVLQAFYGEEVAAYLEAVALQPASPEALKAAVDAVQSLDPGRPMVLDALAGTPPIRTRCSPPPPANR